MKAFRPTPNDVKYLQDALYVIGGKWRLQIMLSLANGNRRFTDIRKSIPKITTRMLSKELKELEINKIIVRKPIEPSVVVAEYEVSDYCKSFEPMLYEMIKWGKEHRSYLKERG